MNYLKTILCCSIGALLTSNTFCRGDVLYATFPGSDSIMEFNSQGVETTFVNLSFQPSGLVADLHGNLYTENGDTIEKISPQGLVSAFATSLNGGPMAFGPNGNLYISEIGSIVQQFDPQGNATIFAHTDGSYPQSLVSDAAGNLYQTAVNGGGIAKFDTQGNESYFATISGSFPHGLAIDSSGNLYAALDNGTTVKIDPSGHVSLFSAYLGGSFSMAFDSSGNLYEEVGHTMYKLDPNGNASVFAANLPFYADMVFEPTPETYSTWALLVLGFGALLAHRHFTRRRSS